MSDRLSLVEMESRIGERRLIASDFDGTQAGTLDSYDGLIGVAEAYRLGVAELFSDDALEDYKQEGEHNNRTPAQIVESLNPGMSADELEVNTKMLVDFKLDILLSQIGKTLPCGGRWPLPTEGFVEFCEQLQAVNKEEKVITTAVLSAGHTSFIEKTYDMWGVELPDFMITGDTLNDLGLGSIPEDHKAKPAPLLMALSKAQWLAGQDIAISSYSDETAPAVDSRIIYVGDDDKKDRELAAASNVGFVLVEPGKSKESWRRVACWAGLGNVSILGVVNNERT